jgi:hypothetical protein
MIRRRNGFRELMDRVLESDHWTALVSPDGTASALGSCRRVLRVLDHKAARPHAGSCVNHLRMTPKHGSECVSLVPARQRSHDAHMSNGTHVASPSHWDDGASCDCRRAQK